MAHGARARDRLGAVGGSDRAQRGGVLDLHWSNLAFFVYSDEVDFCKRLHDSAWTVLYVPDAECPLRAAFLPPGVIPERRIVELSRNRDRYMRKHHPREAPRAPFAGPTAVDLRAARTRRSSPLPGHDSRGYWRHVTATLLPGRGEGLREAALDYNRGGRRL